jgi:hypothetical protein
MDMMDGFGRFFLDRTSVLKGLAYLLPQLAFGYTAFPSL